MTDMIPIEQIEITKPNFAYVYSKVARHVTAAQIHLSNGYKTLAQDELRDAMAAIKQFETMICVVHPAKQPKVL